MFQYNGDSLLKKFNTININIGCLHPSVIKAWFDTDCAKTKKLLKWLCTFSPQQHCLTEQLLLEYKNIQTDCLRDVEYIERRFPGIFELDEFDIKFKNEEVSFLTQEYNMLDEELRYQKELKTNLSKEVVEVGNKENEALMEYEVAFNHGYKISNDLDLINSEIYAELIKNKTAFNDEGSDEDFFTIASSNSAFNADEMEAKFNTIMGCLLNQEDNDDSVHDESSKGLDQIEKRIYNSKKSLLAAKMREVENENVLKYLDEVLNFKQVLNDWSDNISLKLKKEQSLLLTKLDEMIAEMVRTEINTAKGSNDNNKLVVIKQKSEYLNRITELLANVTGYYIMAYLLGSNKSHIHASMKAKLQDIYKLLVQSKVRRNAMDKVIDEFDQFNKKPIEKKLQIFEDVALFLGKTSESSHSEIVGEIVCMRDSIKELERRRFIVELKRPAKPLNLLKNIECMRRYLHCGLTDDFVIVSPLVKPVLRDVRSCLERQKNAVQLSMNTLLHHRDKRLKDPKLRAMGRLWVHFLTDADKFHQTLQILQKN